MMKCFSGCKKKGPTGFIKPLVFGLTSMFMFSVMMWAFNHGEQNDLDENIVKYTARVCAIASFFYLIMFLSTLDANMAKCADRFVGNHDMDGNKIEGARYVDWLFTTPCWLYPLCIAGGLNDEGKFWAVILLDLVTNTCGTLAAYTGRKQYRKQYFFYAIGCVTYITNLCIWFVSDWFDDNELMNAMKTKTAVAWSLYPVVFYLFVIQGIGRSDEDKEGKGKPGEPGYVEVIAFAIMDCYAKGILTIEFLSYKHYDELTLGTIGQDDLFFHMKFFIVMIIFGFIQYIYGNTDSCKPVEPKPENERPAIIKPPPDLESSTSESTKPNFL